MQIEVDALSAPFPLMRIETEAGWLFLAGPSVVPVSDPAHSPTALTWESAGIPGAGALHRAQVAGGWLIGFSARVADLCFVPDPEHTWDWGSLEWENLSGPGLSGVFTAPGPGGDLYVVAQDAPGVAFVASA